MPEHIGIVACSAEGAALCYRTICAEGAQLLGPHGHPEVSMHTPPLADYVRCLERGDVDGVGELMLASARKLASIGAGFLICPDNTIHQAFGYVGPRSPLPWLHIAEVVAAEAASRGYRRLGLTGTRWLVDSDVYPEKLAARGLDWLRPSVADRAEISRIIMDELVCGVFAPESTAYLQRVIRRFKDAGCDAVVLGCTEIPLIVNDGNSSLPTLDSTRLLARAALSRAVHGPALVREAADGDLDSVQACLTAAFAPYEGSYTPEAFRDTVPSREALASRARVMTILIAEQETGRTVGTIAYEAGASGEGHLRGMAVLPQALGSGTATRLLEAAERALAAAGCKRVMLDTTQPLQRAIHFYERHGYTATGRVTDFFGMPLFEYAKELGTGK